MRSSRDRYDPSFHYTKNVLQTCSYDVIFANTSFVNARYNQVLGGEAQLDIQYIMALAPNITTTFWSTAGRELDTGQEPFLDWLMQLSDTEDEHLPLVHSVSYADDEPSMPQWFTRRCNLEFLKLGNRL